ncbi:MAG TPA: hypothetical protein VJT73_17020 [Polyangiaceae bacterium]|nr:hypothetical protein [Polyangiaceae bacterium]
MSTDELSAQLWDPRLWRKLWFDALTQAFDGYLRSTAFLEAMQQGVRTMAVRLPSERPSEQTTVKRPSRRPPKRLK